MSISDPLQLAIRSALDQAARDQAFRTLCLQDPARAIEEISGLTLPSDSHLRFVEQPNGNDIPLPPFRPGEFTDAELESVAGGGIISGPIGPQTSAYPNGPCDEPL